MESSIDLLEPTFPEDMNVSPCLNNPILIDVCTQTDAILTDICMQTDAVVDVPSNCLTNNSDDKNLNCNALRRKCFMDGVIENNVTCLFWTGVPNLNLLNYIFEWVMPCAEKTKLWMGYKRHEQQSDNSKPRKRLLTLFEEYVLVLVRIRRGFDTTEVGSMFGVSQSHVSHVFITWVNLLYKCLVKLLEWPSAEMIQHNMPKSFKKPFSDHTCDH